MCDSVAALKSGGTARKQGGTEVSPEETVKGQPLLRIADKSSIMT